jgi:chromosomal replication initiator protein
VQVSEQDELWTAVAQILRSQLTESVWWSTFHDVSPIVIDEHVLVVRVPSTLARDRILNRYLPIVTEAMAEIGLGDRTFHVEIEPSADPGATIADQDGAAVGSSGGPAAATATASHLDGWSSPGGSYRSGPATRSRPS